MTGAKLCKCRLAMRFARISTVTRAHSFPSIRRFAGLSHGPLSGGMIS